MYWRFKWFLYWLGFLAIYLAGWGVYEGLRLVGLSHTIALAGGIIVGLVLLGVAGYFGFQLYQRIKVKQRTAEPMPTDPTEGLDERQQQLMMALQQAVQSEGEMVVQAYGDPNNPNYQAVPKPEDEEPSSFS